MSLCLRRNDTVRVITGKERGKTGKILALYPEKGRALVEKLNMVKKHRRPTAQNRQGGIIEKEAPLVLSNLMIVCSKCQKPTRIGIRLKSKEAGKERYCRKCGGGLDG